VEYSKPPPYRKQGCLDGYGLPTNNRHFPRILTELLSEGERRDGKTTAHRIRHEAEGPPLPQVRCGVERANQTLQALRRPDAASEEKKEVTKNGGGRQGRSQD